MPEAAANNSKRRDDIVLDKELEIYRSVIEEPTEFKEGFTWIAVAGAFFCGLLMMPGAIYLSLITGGGIAAAWVTLIIFSEVTRRAMRTMSKQELVILLMVAGGMASALFGRPQPMPKPPRPTVRGGSITSLPKAAA